MEVLGAVTKMGWFSFCWERLRARETPMPPVEQHVVRIDLTISSMGSRDLFDENILYYIVKFDELGREVISAYKSKFG